MQVIKFALGLTLGAVLAVGVSATTQAQSSSASETGQTVTPRIIVKLRESRTTDSAGLAGDAADVADLAVRTGVSLRQTRSIVARLRVVQLGVLNAPGSVSAALARLRSDPNVEFAVIDGRKYANAMPNDPMFPAPVPADGTGQWFLANDATTPSAIDATDAWDTTTGSTGVVVAVLDTGVRFEHEDLGAAGGGGRLLPGFDFVSDPNNSNDGNGWDSDASDPGDWVSQSAGTTACPASSSSWHGTRVAGVIGARTDNAVGVAGVTWSGWLLPVRVLGKCGGSDSDIVAAMLWAAGIPVNGAPHNPYPARIINMSLGGPGTCSTTSSPYPNVIQQLTAAGVLVVASAGNEGTVVDEPANCPGVAAITGIRHVGTKVGFSNLGPEVALSAPGGNCVNTDPTLPCLYPINSTTNLGTQGPAANGYTDPLNIINVGTSFSAPIVSGIAGLMLSVNGNLTPAELIARLQEGATKPFPVSTDPTVPVCHVPLSSSDTSQTSECNCTTDTCGAGMANARGAVAAALRPVAAVAVPASVTAGQSVSLNAVGSGAACGSSVTGYAWSVVSGVVPPPGIVVGTDPSKATVTAPSSGSYTIRVTVTDSAGRQDSADVVLGPTSATTTAPASAGATACLPAVTPTSNVAVSVSPTSASVKTSGTLTFRATVSGATRTTSVSWFVNDIQGGNATVGTISTSGSYTAPAVVPSPATVTVTAMSVEDPSRSASATVTITQRSSGGGGGGGGGGSTDVVLLLALAGAAAGRSNWTSRQRGKVTPD